MRPRALSTSVLHLRLAIYWPNLKSKTWNTHSVLVNDAVFFYKNWNDGHSMEAPFLFPRRPECWNLGECSSGWISPSPSMTEHISSWGQLHGPLPCSAVQVPHLEPIAGEEAGVVVGDDGVTICIHFRSSFTLEHLSNLILHSSSQQQVLTATCRGGMVRCTEDCLPSSGGYTSWGSWAPNRSVSWSHACWWYGESFSFKTPTSWLKALTSEDDIDENYRVLKSNFTHEVLHVVSWKIEIDSSPYGCTLWSQVHVVFLELYSGTSAMALQNISSSSQLQAPLLAPEIGTGISLHCVILKQLGTWLAALGTNVKNLHGLNGCPIVQESWQAFSSTKCAAPSDISVSKLGSQTIGALHSILERARGILRIATTAARTFILLVLLT